MSSRGESSRGRYAGRSTSSRGRSSGRGRSNLSFQKRPIASSSVSNTLPELGMPPSIHPSLQIAATTISPLVGQVRQPSSSAPPVQQTPPAPPAQQPPPTPLITQAEPPAATQPPSSPAVTQPLPASQAEPSAHASQGQAEAMDGQSNVSNNIGSSYFITPDDVLIDSGIKGLIHELVQGHYKEPWTGWGKVPKDVRHKMFTAFKGVYMWEPQYENAILTHFNHEASKWLTKHLYLAHQVYKAPFEWMPPVVWEGLQKYWDSEEFKKISEHNKKNREASRSSSIIVYRGGSISTAVHHLRLVDELGREPTQKECFLRTHGKKGTLEGERAIEIVENFDKALADRLGQGQDESSINQDALWDDIAKGSRKRVVGKGNMIRLMSCSKYKPQSGPFGLSGQLQDKVEELEAELARTREHHAREISEIHTRRESFEASLLAALQLKGIDLSDVLPVVGTTPPVNPRASTGESQSRADEHSPLVKRPRVACVADNPAEGVDDEELDDLR